MLAKRILPCLDVNAGRVVKGVNFVDLKDAGDPVELARLYNEAGADELVFLDITATHEGRDTMIDVVYRTAEEVFIPLTVGGGIQSLENIKNLLPFEEIFTGSNYKSYKHKYYLTFMDYVHDVGVRDTIKRI